VNAELTWELLVVLMSRWTSKVSVEIASEVEVAAAEVDQKSVMMRQLEKVRCLKEVGADSAALGRSLAPERRQLLMQVLDYWDLSVVVFAQL
jgi:hypothetical protein